MEGHPDNRVFLKAVRNQLIEEERRRFFEHLIECDECRFKYASMKLNTREKFENPHISVILRFSYVISAFILFILFGIFSNSVKSYRLNGSDVIHVSYVDSSVYDSDSFEIKRIFVDTAILNLYRFRGNRLDNRSLKDTVGDFIRIESPRAKGSF